MLSRTSPAAVSTPAAAAAAAAPAQPKQRRAAAKQPKMPVGFETPPRALPAAAGTTITPTSTTRGLQQPPKRLGSTGPARAQAQQQQQQQQQQHPRGSRVPRLRRVPPGGGASAALPRDSSSSSSSSPAAAVGGDARPAPGEDDAELPEEAEGSGTDAGGGPIPRLLDHSSIARFLIAQQGKKKVSELRSASQVDSEQLREMHFLADVARAEEFEKSKQVKWFPCIGAGPMSKKEVQDILRARAEAEALCLQAREVPPRVPEVDPAHRVVSAANAVPVWLGGATTAGSSGEGPPAPEPAEKREEAMGEAGHAPPAEGAEDARARGAGEGGAESWAEGAGAEGGARVSSLAMERFRTAALRVITTRRHLRVLRKLRKVVQAAQRDPARLGALFAAQTEVEADSESLSVPVLISEANVRHSEFVFFSPTEPRRRPVAVADYEPRPPTPEVLPLYVPWEYRLKGYHRVEFGVANDITPATEVRHFRPYS